MEDQDILTGRPFPDSGIGRERISKPARSRRAGGDPEKDVIDSQTQFESRGFRHEGEPRPDPHAHPETLRFWISVLAPLVGSLAIAAVLVFQIRQLKEIARPPRNGNVSASYSWVDTVSDRGAAGNPGQAFAQTYSVPAGFLVANKTLRVTAFFDFSTSSAPPKLTLVLQLGKTNIAAMTATAPAAAPPSSASIEAAVVEQGSATWTIQGIEPAGPSASIYAGSFLNLPGVGAANSLNNVPQPVMGIDTASAATLDIAAVWGPGDPGNSSLTLQQLLVEALN